jgi:methyltransferase
MELTRAAFLGLLAAVGIVRLGELRVSRRNQRRLLAQGAKLAADPSFRWMALLHAGVLVGAGAEVWLLRRPFVPLLAAVSGLLFLSANAMRWWVIRTLGGKWSVEVMDSSRLGVVDHGPYRYVRHPNYTAVFVEMLALPLIHTAWLTAVASAPAHWLVLRARVKAEDRILMANPEYRTKMGQKPRFAPRILSNASDDRRSALPGSPLH